MTRKWVRLTGDLATDPDMIEEYGEDYDRNEQEYLYGLEGKPWPRIVVNVGRYPCHGPVLCGTAEIGISVSRKDEPGQWWDRASLPEELLPDLIERLQKHIPSMYGDCRKCGAALYKHNFISPLKFKCLNRSCTEFDKEFEKSEKT